MPYRYQNTTIKKTSNSPEPMYSNNVYPDIPVVDGDYYVISTLGDRLDIMAKNYYGDESFWWVIASANSLPGDSLYPPVGAQLRIPINVRAVYDEYRQFNSNR